MNSSTESGGEKLQIRIHGDASLPTLIYLPGLHGDWTLVTSFRIAIAGHARFVEFTYPRTLEWSLDDYATAIDAALVEHGITHGWLLGESYGSQIVWPLIQRAKNADGARHFVPDGVVLAGGFARHPFQVGVNLARRIGRGVSLAWITRFLFWYAKFARFRHRHAVETLASIVEFISRRTELDKRAAVHRLELVAASDPGPILSQTALPVFALTGFWDPIVPWPFVMPGLKRNCRGYRGSRIIFSADHNVLSTAPKESVRQIMAWMTAATPPPKASQSSLR
jgi:pimeloyl-ACP methyl ester carboxylesterase